MSTEAPSDYYRDGYPNMPSDWLSDTNFDLGWISGLQNVANKTLGQIYPEYDEFYINPDDPLNFDHLDTDVFIDGGPGPVIYLAIWLAILVFFAIVGLCWCCINKCCCCCKSSFKGRSGRSIDELENTDPNYQLRPYYSERNDKKSGGITVGAVVLSIIMGVWLVGFLILILHTFASNDKQNEAIDRIQPDLENAIGDIREYLDVTKSQLNHSFMEGFTRLDKKLYEIVELCDCDETMKARIRQGVGSGTQQTQPTIDTRSAELSNALVNVEVDMEDAKKELDGDFEDVISDVNDGLYWLFMLFNVLYCIIFGLVLIGTVLAAFGRGKGLKTCGFLLIRGAIVLTFIVTIFVIIQLAAMFIIAGVSSEILCPAVRDLEKEPVVGATDSTLNQEDGGWVVPNIGEILRACKKDESAYKAFDLVKVYDVNKITEIVDNFNIPIIIVGGRTNGTAKQGYLTPEQTVTAIQSEVSRYAEFVRDSIQDDLGKCEPAYLAINATVSLFCDKITMPVASYWWILQFIPLVFALIFVTALFFERILS